MNNPLLEAAIHYSENLKWSIIPLSPGSKIPPKGFSVIPFRDRIATREEIEVWWKENPQYNIGIITGKLSNLFVIDHDKHKRDYSEEEALKYIPDSIVTPTASTPNGGQHQYFLFPESNITIGTSFLPSMDYRGEGGYIAAPPSVNGTGKEYRWLIDPMDYALADVPDAIVALLKGNIYNTNKSTLYAGPSQHDTKYQLQTVTPVISCDFWADGKRDESLFHLALCLNQTKNGVDYISQTLMAVMKSWGEFDERWANAKIQSVIQRSERKERNIQAEVDCYIAVTDGDFSVTEAYRLLQVVTKEDKASVRSAFHRRKDVTIQKVGCKDGIYRRIDKDVVHIDFTEEQGGVVNIKLPLNLDSLVNICEGNIILVSGEYNAGKTTFSLNALAENKNRMKIRFISSEMRAGEFKSRWKTFPYPAAFWAPDEMTEYVELGNNLSNLILPDALNIIDYLEFRDGDYTKGAEYMRQIHDKLKQGVAIVCNQQKEGVRLPRSGDLIMEKPRLAVTFRKVSTENDDVIGIAEIQKAKNVKIGKVDGKKLRYQLLDNGSRFKVLNNWGWWKDARDAEIKEAQADAAAERHTRGYMR
jgi:hypothetical protein